MSRRWGIAGLTGAGLLAAAVAAQVATGVIQKIDDGARARYENVLGFTDTEHYMVFRGQDESHPAAEMTVRTTYRKGMGKSYEIVSQAGSGVIIRFALMPLLDNEKEVNLPGNVEKSWFTSANYEMEVKPGTDQRIDGRDCVAVAMKPKRKAPNMIDGTLWVDAGDAGIVKVEGVASKRPSIFAGTTHIMRQYMTMNGYAMATHARAESSGVFGRTVVVIDYRDYKLEVKRGDGVPSR